MISSKTNIFTDSPGGGGGGGTWVFKGVHTRVCEKEASDLWQGGGFAGYSGFHHQLQMTSHELAAIWQKK